VAGTNQLNLSSTATTITQPTTTPMITLTNVNSSQFYQEGTWTVTMGDGTYNMTLNSSSSTGYYTRIGNIIHVNVNAAWISKGSASGTLEVSLPFTANATKMPAAAFVVGICLGFPSSDTFIGVQGNASKNYVYFFIQNSSILCSALSSGGSACFSGFYSI